MKKIIVMILMAGLLVLAGCRENEEPLEKPAAEEPEEKPVKEEPVKPEAEEPEPEKEPEPEPVMEEEEPAAEEPEEERVDKKLIVIDPGHSRVTNAEKEPIGPGSAEQKAKSVTGTRGAATGLMEYELNLIVSEKLEEELISRGYEVKLTRRDHEEEISNIARSDLANLAEADAFIRIHADGADDAGAEGMMTICQTAQNPYNGNIYEACRALSDAVLSGMTEQTGAKNRGVWETDTMTGINWSEVPVTIVEMGFMTNPEEDRQLASEEYQGKIVQGIADGLDTFFDVNADEN